MRQAFSHLPSVFTILLRPQPLVWLLLLGTYLLDALLFFYYRKNNHLDAAWKNRLILLSRLLILGFAVLKTKGGQ